MQLPLFHTFTRNDSVRAIKNGSLAHFRLKLQSQQRYIRLWAPWTTAEDAIELMDQTGSFIRLFVFPA